MRCLSTTYEVILVASSQWFVPPAPRVRGLATDHSSAAVQNYIAVVAAQRQFDPSTASAVGGVKGNDRL